MPVVRAFQNPDGTVRIMRLNERHRLPNETDEQFFARETAKQPELAVLPFADIVSADIPLDRTRRHAWRLQAGAIVIDPTVPPTLDQMRIIKKAGLQVKPDGAVITIKDLKDLGIL